MRKQASSSTIKRSYTDKIFDIVNLIVMIILLLIFVWPLWFVVIASFSDPNEVWNGNVLLLPKGFTLLAYEALGDYSMIWRGYANTIFYTVVGTIVNLIMTVCAAYPLSRKDFVPRNFFMFMFMLTMYFSGGLIPTYLIVSDVGLINTPWAMIIPGACSIYNVIITRTYFINSIPSSLQEAAEARMQLSQTLKYSVIIVSTVPVLCVYPFIQKYFVKGVMIGSVKG